MDACLEPSEDAGTIRRVSDCEREDHIAGLLRHGERTRGEAAAIRAPDGTTLTYGDLWRYVNSSGKRMREWGIGDRDIVALAAAPGVDLAVGFLCIASSAVCMPLAADMKSHEIEELFSRVGPAALVADPAQTTAIEIARRLGVRVSTNAFDRKSCRREAAGRAQARSADDIALLLQTAGTTARSKLVPLSHRNLVTSAGNLADSVKLTPQDRCLTFLPLHHAQGILSGLLSTLISGGTVAIHPALRLPEFFRWLVEFRPTWYTAVPAMHEAIVRRAPDHRAEIAKARLRCIRSGGATLGPTLQAELERVFGVPVIEAYGMTEAGTPIATNPLPPGVRKPGTVGRPLGCQIAILAPKGGFLPPGSEGEIVLRGPTVFSGYWDPSDANAKSFRNGWFRTGDLGFFDSDRYLTLTGRCKEIINRGGEKISPRRIEEALLDHPSVKQAVAFSLPHSTLGEEVAAAVVLRRGSPASTDELQRRCLLALPEYAVPRRIEIVKEIPKGPSGKVQRNRMAALLGIVSPPPGQSVPPVPGQVESIGTGSGESRTHAQRRAASMPLDSVIAELRSIWAKVLGRDSMGPHDGFFDLGGNSLHASLLLAQIERRFGVRLAGDALIRFPTIHNLATIIRQGSACQPFSYLVALCGRGPKPGLFLVHAPDGLVLPFRFLAHLAGRERPVYGIQPPPAKVLIRPGTKYESLARLYVDEIIRAQPQGPYYLAGYCGGGVIAFEIARHLERTGRRVGIVSLFDPVFRSRRMEHLVVGALLTLFSFPAFEAPLWRLPRRILTAVVHRSQHPDAARRAGGTSAPPITSEFSRTFYSLLRKHHNHRRMGPISARVQLIFSERNADYVSRGIEEWQGLTSGGLTTHVVPGHHFNLLAEENAPHVAECLIAEIDAAERGET
jgi:acyl-CoA synthetase (AMP-forming)/AMP-acid ligase II/thioesterase domain-containing protein/acyl carrier protein